MERATIFPHFRGVRKVSSPINGRPGHKILHCCSSPLTTKRRTQVWLDSGLHWQLFWSHGALLSCFKRRNQLGKTTLCQTLGMSFKVFTVSYFLLEVWQPFPLGISLSVLSSAYWRMETNCFMELICPPNSRYVVCFHEFCFLHFHAIWHHGKFKNLEELWKTELFQPTICVLRPFFATMSTLFLQMKFLQLSRILLFLSWKSSFPLPKHHIFKGVI